MLDTLLVGKQHKATPKLGYSLHTKHARTTTPLEAYEIALKHDDKQSYMAYSICSVETDTYIIPPTQDTCVRLSC